MKDTFENDGVYLLEGSTLNNILRHVWQGTQTTKLDKFDVANAVQVNVDDAMQIKTADCSFCGNEILYYKTFNHCPHCGAA